MEISREEFQGWMELIREDISGVHSRLDGLNGRTRTAESAIAVLQNQRSEDVKRMDHAAESGRDATARVTGYGALIVSVVTALMEYFKHRP